MTLTPLSCSEFLCHFMAANHHNYCSSHSSVIFSKFSEPVPSAFFLFLSPSSLISPVYLPCTYSSKCLSEGFLMLHALPSHQQWAEQLLASQRLNREKYLIEEKGKCSHGTFRNSWVLGKSSKEKCKACGKGLEEISQTYWDTANGS